MLAQDLEAANKRLLASDLIVRPEDFIARTEHTRLLESTLAMKQSELNREMERRLSQQERDARFALDSREAELRKTSASHDHQVGSSQRMPCSVWRASFPELIALWQSRVDICCLCVQ